MTWRTNPFSVTDKTLLQWRNTFFDSLRNIMVYHPSWQQIRQLRCILFVWSQWLFLLISNQFLAFSILSLSIRHDKDLDFGVEYMARSSQCDEWRCWYFQDVHLICFEIVWASLESFSELTVSFGEFDAIPPVTVDSLIWSRLLDSSWLEFAAIKLTVLLLVPC